MSWIFVTGLFLSGVIGLSLGMIGGGGSILTVPILVYFLGVDPHDAVGMSLAVVGSTSLIGAILHWRAGSLDLAGGSLFGGAGMVGAFLGAPLTKLFSAEALLLIFGGLMLLVAVMMLRRKRFSEAEHDVQPAKAIAAGAGVGVLTGFLGVGGGFLVVPALIVFGGLSMKKAVGTSLLVIFINCVAGLVAHLGQGTFEWSIAFAVTVLALAGAIGGTALSRKLEAQRLQRLFAVLVLIVGAILIAKNFSVLA